MAANTLLNDDDSLPGHWKAAAPFLMTVGAVAILISFGLCYMAPTDGQVASYTVFLHSYLANFIYCLTFCIGALFFVLVTNLARAAWCATIRRVAEILALNIGWWAVMFLPILVMVFMGRGGFLYEWNDTATTDLPADKLMYLNGGWFAARALIYFAIWGGVGYYYFSKSREQDETGSAEISLKLQRYAGPGIILFALALNFAAFDWIMSLDAKWFSTMFGVYTFAGSMMAFYAFMIVTFTFLQKNGRVQKYVNVEHFHDMSKFLFGFVFFWSYITFSQFLLIWYGNIPEETQWFDRRMTNGWEIVGLLIIVGHFALPMLCLLSRHVRRNRAVMCGWGIFLLVMHWVDITFMIMPETGNPGPAMWLGHAVCALGMVCMFLSVLILRVGSTPLVAKRNPWVPDALSYHVM